MDELIAEENSSLVEGTIASNMIKPLPDETAPRHAEYLGSFPVSGRTPEERATYVGKQLELISKRNPESLKPVCIAMTLGGVKICDPTMKEVYMAHALRRISYTTCIPLEKILAFVSRNPGQPLTNQYCHTFKTDHATEINSIIGGAFLTAYTLKRRKNKKRLSLEITSPDDYDHDNDADSDSITSEHSDHQSPTALNRPAVKKPQLKSRLSGSSQLSQDLSPSKNKRLSTEKHESSNTETAAGGFSELETRVFAALNEKAQAKDISDGGVVSRRSASQKEFFDDRHSVEKTRVARRPMSYHEPSNRAKRSSSKQYLREFGQVDETLPEDITSTELNISNLRLSDKANECEIEDSDIIDRKQTTSLGQNMRNLNATDAYMRAREAELRMRTNLEAQISADTMKSTAGGCAPSKSITDYLPFRFSKKKKEKKKYTRSKTESVLVADRTFGRMWKPNQLNASDNVPFSQRTELIPTNSMMSINSNSPDARVRLSLAESYRLGSSDIIQSEIDSVLGRNRGFEQKRAKSPPTVDTLSDLPRQRSSLASGTTCTATTSSSSCPSSSYLTDATCEDSGMYTQSSKSSSSSSDSCERQSSRSSGCDSLLSGSSANWISKSSTNLETTIEGLDPSKSNARRLRNSLAGQMISADSFVSLDSKLLSAAWYHPGVPIDVAMGILKGEEDGSFLVVRPIRKGASYTLVMSARGTCKLFNIFKIEKVGYHIEGKNQFFPHVYIMIAQYSCHPGPLPYKLKSMQLFNPLCRERLEKQ